MRIAIRVDSRPVVYLFGTRVRSWQKALAGAARRIRCHSHPRMLLHSEPCALCIALILSLALSLSLSLSLRFLPRPSLAHSRIRVSLLVPRRPHVSCFTLNAFSFRFQPSLSLLPSSITDSLPTTVSIQRHVLRRARLFHKPINVRNKLEIGSVLHVGNVNAREDDGVIPRDRRLDVERFLFGEYRIQSVVWY